MAYVDPLTSPTAGWYYGSTYDPNAINAGGATASAGSSSFLSAIDPILGIASTILTGVEKLGSDAISKSMTSGEISLQIEENTRNVASMKDYLTNDFESIASQQRTELDKSYQDIYDSLMNAWGSQSVGYATADQEAVAGGSVQAVMGKTRESVVYNFGEDLQKDSSGGLFALATTNLENDIENSRQNIQNAIETGERSNAYYEDAKKLNDANWFEKIGLGIATAVGSIFGQSSEDVVQGYITPATTKKNGRGGR
jgi:hypothetical protein